MTPRDTRRRRLPRPKPTRFGFGGTAAIVTSMGLVVGLDVAANGKAPIVSGLLIVALADNLTDSLSVHVYQEAEQLEAREAFRSTVTNFITRLGVALTFVLLVLALPLPWVLGAVLAWGVFLLAALTTSLARARGASAGVEIVKHLGVTVVVLALSRGLGAWIAASVR